MNHTHLSDPIRPSDVEPEPGDAVGQSNFLPHRIIKRPKPHRLRGLQSLASTYSAPFDPIAVSNLGRTSPFESSPFAIPPRPQEQPPEIIDLTDDSTEVLRVANSSPFDPDVDIEMQNASADETAQPQYQPQQSVAQDDDDDVVEIVEELPSRVESTEAPMFNQPAPVPHFGPGHHDQELARIKEHEVQQRMSLLRNEIIQIQNAMSAKKEELDRVAHELNLITLSSPSRNLGVRAQQLQRKIANLQDELVGASNTIHSKQNSLHHYMESTPEGRAQLERRRRRKEKLQKLERERIEKQRAQRERLLREQNQQIIRRNWADHLPGSAEHPDTHTRTTGHEDSASFWGLPSDIQFSGSHNTPISRFHSIQPANQSYHSGALIDSPTTFDMQSGSHVPEPYQPQGYSSNIYSTNNITDTKDLQELMKNIQAEENENEQEYSSTPPDLAVPLLKHQRMGLSWLLRMETSQAKGSILADDMGLGKTIQALALMVANKSTDPKCKTNLVVGPVSLLRQWAAEIDTKIKPEFALKVGFYHGSTKAKFKTFKDIAQFDVMLTSYPTLQSEWKKHYSEVFRKEKVTKNMDVLPDPNAGGEKYQSPFFGPDAMFYRVILDEAHSIKNKLSQSSKAVATLKAEYRLCLTGTPMQNSVDELYPILRFLKIRPYCDEHRFRSHISIPLKSQSEDKDYEQSDGIRKLRALLKATLLRRSKDSKIDGKPILNLPEKHIIDDYISMSTSELEDYKNIEKGIQNKAKKLLGIPENNFSNILVLLLRLRQACCHVFLSQLGSMKAESYRAKSWPTLYKSVLKLDGATHARLKNELPISGASKSVMLLDKASETSEDDLGNLSELIERLTVSSPESRSMSPVEKWTSNGKIEVVHLDDSDTENATDFDHKFDVETPNGDLMNAVAEYINGDNSIQLSTQLKEENGTMAIHSSNNLHDEPNLEYVDRDMLSKNIGESSLKKEIAQEVEQDDKQLKANDDVVELFEADTKSKTIETSNVIGSSSASGSAASFQPKNEDPMKHGANHEQAIGSLSLTIQDGDHNKQVGQLSTLFSTTDSDFDNDGIEDKQGEGIFTCPICFNAVSVQQIIGFPCQHKVCEECVDEFFRSYETEYNGPCKAAKCNTCGCLVKETELVDYKLYHMIHNEGKTKDQIRAYFQDNYDKNGKQLNIQKIMTLIKANGGFEPSAKMVELLKLLKDILKKDPKDKIIIFSQFTTYLDLLKMMLKEEGLSHLRYDGTMSIEQKDFAVRKFYSSDVPVMLISLRAGNVGLTLTCASHVIIMDPFWNPFVEEQAMDRAHRIGQQREVFVHRVLVKETIEERIITLQTNKKELILAALDEGGMKNISSLNRRELGYLFGLNEL